MSHHGAPSPVNAGTRYTPPVLLIDWASASVSAAWDMIFSSSRSHWMVAPPINTLPSSAKTGFPPIRRAMVVSSPFRLCTGVSPVFISIKQPVP